MIVNKLDFEIYIGNKLILSPGSKNYGVTSARLDMSINEPGTLSLSIENYGIIAMGIEIKPYKTLGCVNMHGECIFAGRVINVAKNIYGNTEIELEGAIAALNDICIPYREGYYETVGDFVDKAIDNYNYILSNTEVIDEEDAIIHGNSLNGIEFYHNAKSHDSDKFEIVLQKIDQDGNPIEDTTPMSYVKPLETFSSKVLNRKSALLYPTYTYTTHESDDEEDGEEESDSTKFDATIRVDIEYAAEIHGGIGYEDIDGCPAFITGTNILDLSEEPSKWTPYSGILPVGKDGLTIGKHEEYTYDDVVWDSSLEDIYGRIVKVVEFSEVEYTSDLINLAAEYIQMYSRNPGTKFAVTGIEPLLIFDNVTEISKIGHAGVVNGYVSPFLSIRSDFFNLQNWEYVLGPLVPEGIINEDVTHLNRRS